MAGNIAQTDGFFVLTVLCETSPQILQLLLKLDQSLCGEIRSHMGDSETELSEATQRPFREQISDSKFRQTMALVPRGKHSQLSKVTCCLWRVAVG